MVAICKDPRIKFSHVETAVILRQVASHLAQLGRLGAVRRPYMLSMDEALHHLGYMYFCNHHSFLCNNLGALVPNPTTS